MWSLGRERREEESLQAAAVCVQQGVWLGRGFVVVPVAAAGGTSGGRLAEDAGTGSDLAATAESAEQPTEREREREREREGGREEEAEKRRKRDMQSNSVIMPSLNTALVPCQGRISRETSKRYCIFKSLASLQC